MNIKNAVVTFDLPWETLISHCLQ